MKNIAVILAGCGHMDGSEITEAVSTLICLSKHKAKVQCFSLNKQQRDVINHLNKSEVLEKRNLLEEAARIARGNIQNLNELKSNNFDALIIPGGLGIAKNLFDYAQKGRDCSIDSLVEEKILEFNKNKKYIGAICISPMLLARTFKDSSISPKLTLGTADAPANDAEYFGAKHEKKSTKEICIDSEQRIVTTPAFMHGNSSVYEVFTGIEKLVKYIVENC